MAERPAEADALDVYSKVTEKKIEECLKQNLFNFFPLRQASLGAFYIFSSLKNIFMFLETERDFDNMETRTSSHL